MRVLVCCVVVLVFGHCTSGVSRQPEPVATVVSEAPVIAPPPPSELTEVRRLMWKLAREVRLLGFLTDSPDTAESDARTHLGAMEEAVTEIAKLPERRSHPMLDTNVDALLRDIRTARAQVAGDSPEWGMTRSITTACVRCHGLRTCPFDSYETCVDVPVY